MKKHRELRHPEFDVRERQDGLSGKTIVTARHRTGLQISLIDFPGFSRAFSAATVPFGSIHTAFQLDQSQKTLPAGTAHFLEHCVFSRDEDGGLMGRLSDLGASANAYTTYDHTLYYFSATSRFEEALSCWLDALLTLQIDRERIEAERPIILAELDQYRDDPDARCSQLLFENMYPKHPVRLDIAGTKSAVSSLSEKDLRLAWDTFYRPENINLTLAGDFDGYRILNLVAEHLKGYQPKNQMFEHLFPEDVDCPATYRQVEQMDLSTPLFLLGLKARCTAGSRRERVTRKRAANLLLDTLLSSVSPLYDELYQAGLINDSFNAQYLDGPGYALILCGGESPEPEQAADLIRNRLVETRLDSIDLDLFETQKRAAAGRIIQMLDSVGQGGMMQARARLHGFDLFDYPLIYDKIDPATALDLFRNLTNPDCYALSIVKPRR